MLGRRGYRCTVAIAPVTSPTPARASRLSLAVRRHPGAALACCEATRPSCFGVFPLPAFMLPSQLGSRMVLWLFLRPRFEGNHPQPDGREYGLGSAPDAELGQNMTHMKFDGF